MALASWRPVGTTRERQGGVLVIRAWLEDGAATELRARLISVDDVASARESISYAASEEEICAVVRSWLADVQSEA